MPNKIAMRDMIVILPGIMGSVLQKNGTDLWNVSGQVIGQIVTSFGNRLKEMTTDNLEAGLYQVTVQTDNTGKDAPNPVHELFEVADLGE